MPYLTKPLKEIKMTNENNQLLDQMSSIDDSLEKLKQNSGCTFEVTSKSEESVYQKRRCAQSRPVHPGIHRPGDLTAFDPFQSNLKLASPQVL